MAEEKEVLVVRVETMGAVTVEVVMGVEREVVVMGEGMVEVTEVVVMEGKMVVVVEVETEEKEAVEMAEKMVGKAVERVVVVKEVVLYILLNLLDPMFCVELL